MTTDANETTLTEDEQFAAAVNGNPLFDAPKVEAGEPAKPAADADDAAGDDPAGTEAPVGDEPAANGGDDGAEAGTTAATGNTTDDGDAGAEPFPGYNALSDEAREAIDQLTGERRKYENDYKALHGMTAPLQRQNSELRRQHDAMVARVQQLEQLGRKQQDVSAAKDKAIQEVDEWAKQYPEESRAVLAMVNPLRDKVTALEGSLTAARAELGNLQTERQQAALAREVDALTEAHGDWREIHGSPDYWEWLKRQTPGIQSLNQSMFAGDTIQLLNLFKGHRAPAPAPTPVKPSSGQADAVQQRRTQTLARGTQPNVRTSESPTRTAGNPNALTDEDAQFAGLVADNPNFR